MQDLESWVKNCSFVWHFLWDQMGSLEKEKARPGLSADSCWHCWAERKPRMTRLESVFITGQWRRVCICLYSSFEAYESYEAWFIEVTSFYQHSSQGQDDEEEEQVWATWVFVPFGIRAGWRTWFERFLFWVQIHSISLVRFYWSIYRCSFNRSCSECLKLSALIQCKELQEVKGMCLIRLVVRCSHS